LVEDNSPETQNKIREIKNDLGLANAAGFFGVDIFPLDDDGRLNPAIPFYDMQQFAQDTCMGFCFKKNHVDL